MNEGKEKDQAVAICHGMWESRDFKELTSEARNALADSSFVFPKERRYPIHDRAHAANALARASGKPEWSRVKRAVCRKYPDLPACKVEHEEVDAMWIEVFKAGTHTASNGIVKTYTDKDLDDIAAKYNSQSDHEAPIVIGHPKDNEPAYGWIKELKRVENKLHAFVEVVSDKFKEAVQKGMFKKVSIALYGDNLLRHIGFLGATPPAVKGLAPVAFREGEEYSEFSTETEESGFLKRLFAWIKNYNEDPIQEEEMSKELTEKIQQLETSYAEAVKRLDEQGKTIEEQSKTIADLKTELADQKVNDDIRLKKVQFEEAKKNFDMFVEGLIKEGKILPAEKESLMSEYEDIYNANSQLTFKENEKPLIDKFRERLSNRPVIANSSSGQFADPSRAKRVDPKDVADEFKQFADIDPSGIELDKQIKEYMEKNKVSYTEAASAISTGS